MSGDDQIPSATSSIWSAFDVLATNRYANAKGQLDTQLLEGFKAQASAKQADFEYKEASGVPRPNSLSARQIEGQLNPGRIDGDGPIEKDATDFGERVRQPRYGITVLGATYIPPKKIF